MALDPEKAVHAPSGVGVRYPGPATDQCRVPTPLPRRLRRIAGQGHPRPPSEGRPPRLHTRRRTPVTTRRRRLWGGWAPPTVQIHVASPSQRSRSERGGIASHRAPEGVVPIMRSGVPTCPAAQVFLDLAAERIDLVDLVAVGDSLVRASAVTPEELVDAAASSGGAGCRLARRAARWVRVGVDSVMETRVRMLIVLAGLPEPTVDHVIRRDDGTWLHRIDLAYLGLLIAIEYDGRQHAENTTQWNKDIRRREDLENRGWRVRRRDGGRRLRQPR